MTLRIELKTHVWKAALSNSKNSFYIKYIDDEDWNNVTIKTINKQLMLYINDSLAFYYKYKINPGKLTGVRAFFNGMGEVDYIKFFNPEGELIYDDEFTP